jgi:hypothetical protein
MGFLLARGAVTLPKKRPSQLTADAAGQLLNAEPVSVACNARARAILRHRLDDQN